MKNLRSFMIGVLIVSTLVVIEILASSYHVTMSDEELVREYYIERYGDGNYTVIIEDRYCDDEYISYECYRSGMPRISGTMSREYLTKKYCK